MLLLTDDVNDDHGKTFSLRRYDDIITFTASSVELNIIIRVLAPAWGQVPGHLKQGCQEKFPEGEL